MRMFAGPNGSGKNTFKDPLPVALLDVYINANDKEAAIRRNGYLEVTNGEELEMKTEQIPNWLKTALWDKFDAEVGEGKP